MTVLHRVTLTRDVTATRLGFGCGGLMRLPSRSARRRLLDAAFDSGMTHFDVARMYGLGQAEVELGRFARGRRSDITIATKFGIETRVGLSQVARLQRPARALLATFPTLRGAIKRRGDLMDTPRHYDARTARRSLEESLKQVGTDYFDILFVHDPRPTDVVDVEELCEFAEEAQREGKIRSWGVASEQDTVAGLMDVLGQEAVLQTRYDIFSPLRPAPGDGRPLILFGFLASALERLTRAAREPGLGKTLARFLEQGDRSIADYLLLDALYAYANPIVLVSTVHPARVSRAMEVAQNMTPADLVSFRTLLTDAGVLPS